MNATSIVLTQLKNHEASGTNMLVLTNVSSVWAHLSFHQLELYFFPKNFGDIFFLLIYPFEDSEINVCHLDARKLSE